MNRTAEVVGHPVSAKAAVADLESNERWWPGESPPTFAPDGLLAIAARTRQRVYVVRQTPGGSLGLGVGGVVERRAWSTAGSYDLVATLPPLYPEWLGDRSFTETHRVRFPYVAGEMANGIATTRLVKAMAGAEMLGFFGAAGLSLTRVEQAVHELASDLGEDASWGVNLIHSPNEPELEERVARLLVQRRVGRISASAFMSLTPAVVHCAAAGLRLDSAGRIQRRTHVFAKVSRPEVAEQFMSPPPRALLDVLVGRGDLTEAEAALAVRLPVAEDITVESDSGGHTDNRPLGALLPAVLGQRDALAARNRYPRPIRVGAAGGLGTPHGIAAAFALGAAYVLTGSVNQVAIESGLSVDAKAMLALADVADVMMAPAADMFELGVKVQVLRRGTMFGVRASRLYETYLAYPGLEAIPHEARARLEAEVLHASINEIWSETRRFWQGRDASELERAEADPKHRMALVFRWYLGMSSRWAIAGEVSRRTDYQIWCGPAMGAFNRWTADSFMAEPSHRSVVQIARNLLEGAAVITRAQQLRSHGVPLPAGAFQFQPRRLA